jgi:hypothetical protein
LGAAEIFRLLLSLGTTEINVVQTNLSRTLSERFPGQQAGKRFFIALCTVRKEESLEYHSRKQAIDQAPQYSLSCPTKRKQNEKPSETNNSTNHMLFAIIR